MNDITRENLSHAAVIAAVVGAAYLALSVNSPATAAEGNAAATEKCFGVAKAGENSCAAANGAHQCAGQSKADFDGQSFKAVPSGTCVSIGGSLTAFNGTNPKKKS